MDVILSNGTCQEIPYLRGGLMQYKFVKLINLKENYKEKNIRLYNYGFVLKEESNILTVIFFNENNIGEYVIIDVNVLDVEVLDFEVPNEFKQKIEDYLNSHTLKGVDRLSDLHFNDCDWVELTVEDEKYTKHNIHKGERGVITDDGKIVGNEVLVDFTGIDKNGNFYGDIISVNIYDLKLIENEEIKPTDSNDNKSNST